MNKIDTQFLERCVETLSRAYELLQQSEPSQIEHEMYRSACVKEYEIILEQCGKLLKMALKPYYHSTKAVDQLFFKEVFKQSVLRSIISMNVCERFLSYRDNRNNTAHSYGVNFAEETILLLPDFIQDAAAIVTALKQQNDDTARKGL